MQRSRLLLQPTGPADAVESPSTLCSAVLHVLASLWLIPGQGSRAPPQARFRRVFGLGKEEGPQETRTQVLNAKRKDTRWSIDRRH